MRRKRLALMFAVGGVLACAGSAQAQEVVDPNLGVRTAASGLSQPVAMAFIGPGDALVLEKASGRVQRVVNGTIQGAVLDLAVNSNSERGLLGIALHPNFASNGFVYLFWSESNTGADSTGSTAVDLLANRVDRFRWNGSTLALDRNIIRFRAFQQDAGQTARGNHNGGVLRFGPDGKLYAIVGDTGRRGQTQNLINGPFGPGIPDDQFGGPAPDDAHRTGVIVRLNDDGTAPTDNPFFAAGAAIGGEVGANVQKLFAYGIRNSFGMAFDPESGDLWEQENGDDSFSEINRVEPGMNSGWIQIMGPASRVAQFKAIETTMGPTSDPLRMSRSPWNFVTAIL
jgi:aldose sugar dehydrogenase